MFLNDQTNTTVQAFDDTGAEITVITRPDAVVYAMTKKGDI